MQIISPTLYQTKTGSRKQKVLFKDPNGVSYDCWDLRIMNFANQDVMGAVETHQFQGKTYNTFNPDDMWMNAKSAPISQPVAPAPVVPVSAPSIPTTQSTPPPSNVMANTEVIDTTTYPSELTPENKLSAKQTSINAACNLFQGTGRSKLAGSVMKVIYKSLTGEELEIDIAQLSLIDQQKQKEDDAEEALKNAKGIFNGEETTK